jgi:hypothetical protein
MRRARHLIGPFNPSAAGVQTRGAPALVFGIVGLALILTLGATPYKPGKRTLWAPRIPQPIAVDARFDDWPAADSVRIMAEDPGSPLHLASVNGPEDLDMWVRSAWDEGYLYFAVRATDDVHQVSHEGPRKIFRTDGIAFFLDLYHNEWPFGQYRDGVHVVWFTADPEVPPDNTIWKIGHDTGQEERRIPHAPCAARLTPGGYVMEIAIPWGDDGLTINAENFGAPTAGRIIGLGLLVGDKDVSEEIENMGEAVRRGLDWGEVTWPGIDDRRDTWGNLRLVETLPAELK